MIVASNVADSIRTVVESMRSVPDGPPFYEAAHPLEVANLLKIKDGEPGAVKYPLIILKLDTIEKVRNGIWNYDLNIIIAAFTNENYTAEQRRVNVFGPVLYPLYSQFFVALKKSGLFMWPSNLIVPDHTKVDRYFYGTQGPQGNTKYIFDDPLDAIEIFNLQINQRAIKC